MSEIEPLWVDYHCHLDLYKDYEAQFRKCNERRIATLAVTTTPRAWPRNKELASGSKMVRVGLGIHPQLVGTNYRQELALFEQHLNETRYIGEIGLDAGPSHYKTYQNQKIVFEAVIKLCAQSKGKILSVHSVRADRDILCLLEKHLAGTDNRMVMHWFSGTASDLKKHVEIGCSFSVNRAMLVSEHGKALIAAMPTQLILTETDGPFIQTGPRPSLSMDVSQTTRVLGELLRLSTDETQTLIRNNLTALERL